MSAERGCRCGDPVPNEAMIQAICEYSVMLIWIPILVM